MFNYWYSNPLISSITTYKWYLGFCFKNKGEYYLFASPYPFNPLLYLYTIRSLSLDVFKWLAKSFRFPKPEINFRILLATSPNRENEKKSPKIASKCKIGHGVGGWRRVSHCHHLFFHNQCPRMDEADSIFLMSTLIGLRLFTRSNPKKHLVA